LYSFCARASCTDGDNPSAGLIMDGSGNLYGTSEYGGAHGSGTVFELKPNAAKSAWTHKVLYSFCAQAGCADGSLPKASLIMDASGNLYGTTDLGGANTYYGTAFELIPNAARTAWKHKVLYSFCTQGGHVCSDGAYPAAGLVMDPSGSLYGTASGGNGADGGTVFQLTPNAAKTAWTYKVLYSFCAQAAPDCATGSTPWAGLIMDASGNLYGTNEFGGAGASGSAFELTPNAAKTTWKYLVLYSFCSQAGCADGGDPVAGLLMGPSGNLIGTAQGGGGLGAGTVFELKR
jgi:uncharacterized repeat protein (TIGR03803 family)